MEYTLKINDILKHKSGEYRITGFKEYGEKPVTVVLIKTEDGCTKREEFLNNTKEPIYFSKSEVKACIYHMTGKNYNNIKLVYNNGIVEQIEL